MGHGEADQCSAFFRKEQPSVKRALPPVGTHRTVLQLVHTTTVCEWLNTVVLQWW